MSTEANVLLHLQNVQNDPDEVVLAQVRVGLGLLPPRTRDRPRSGKNSLERNRREGRERGCEVVTALWPAFSESHLAEVSHW